VTAIASASLAVDAPWIVMKFGGSSVANASCWQNIRDLIASRRAENARVLVVVSALSGVTDALRQLGKCADRDERVAGAFVIAARHRDLLAQLQLP
jgi:diaminopimelate decarboxylase/aspartate kinase